MRTIISVFYFISENANAFHLVYAIVPLHAEEPPSQPVWNEPDAPDTAAPQGTPDINAAFFRPVFNM